MLFSLIEGPRTFPYFTPQRVISRIGSSIKTSSFQDVARMKEKLNVLFTCVLIGLGLIVIFWIIKW